MPLSTCATCAHWRPDESRSRHPKPTEDRRLCTLLSSEDSPVLVVPLSMGAGPKVAVYTGPRFGCSGWEAGVSAVRAEPYRIPAAGFSPQDLRGDTLIRRVRKGGLSRVALADAPPADTYEAEA